MTEGAVVMAATATGEVGDVSTNQDVHDLPAEGEMEVGFVGRILADGDCDGAMKGKPGRFYGPFFTKGRAGGRARLKCGQLDLSLEVTHYELLEMGGVLFNTNRGLWVMSLDEEACGVGTH